MINWWYIEVELEKQLDLGLGYVRQRKSLKGTLLRMLNLQYCVPLNQLLYIQLKSDETNQKPFYEAKC